MDFDSALQHVGEFGSFQKRVYFLVSFLSIPLTMHSLIFVFVGAAPEWQCPSPKGDIMHCNSRRKGCCQNDGAICHGASFSADFTSIATEWNLVCGARYKAELTQSICVAGYMLGVLVFGILSDRFGRRKPWVLAYSLGILVALLSATVSSYQQYIVLRFLIGILVGGGGLVTYVLSTESIGSSFRGTAGTWQQAFSTLGYTALPLLAYFIRDWRVLTAVTILPSLILPFLVRSIPESPRWLASQGRIKEAENILRKIGEENGVDCSKMDIRLRNQTTGDSQNLNYGVTTLFTRKSVCLITVAMVTIWCVNSMVYYGLALNVKNLGGSLYINFALAFVVEVPSFVVTQFLLSWLGRKRSLLYLLLGAGLSCLICMVLQLRDARNSALISTAALAGRFCIAASFAVIYVYTSELFPTVVRNIGLGVSSLSARVGGIVAPFIVLLADYSTSLPMFIFACTAVFAGFVTLMLPETLGKPMPETFEDLEMTFSQKSKGDNIMNHL